MLHVVYAEKKLEKAQKIGSAPEDSGDTGRILNIHKTFRRRAGRLLNVLCTFNLRPVSTGENISFTKIYDSLHDNTHLEGSLT